MAENSTIARPYAQALYEVAAEGDINAWADLVNAMAALAANPEMLAAMSNPRVTEEQLYAVFTGVLDRPLAAQAQNLVRTLISNGRLAVLPDIATQFHALKNAREGSADAHIYSAFAMSDEDVKRLVSDLEKKFKVRLAPTVTLEPALIGGVRVVIGDEVLDNSIQARLEQMRVALSA
jgi:F-type H+-transporting ATPase subunit delta